MIYVLFRVEMKFSYLILSYLILSYLKMMMVMKQNSLISFIVMVLFNIPTAPLTMRDIFNVGGSIFVGISSGKIVE